MLVFMFSAPGAYGEGLRPEGHRLPFPGQGQPGTMGLEGAGPRMPFPQGMGLPPQPGAFGAGPPGMGDMGTQAGPPPKEKKKRRKKKKADETEGAQSQPLPPSIPSQTMLGGCNVSF